MKTPQELNSLKRNKLAVQKYRLSAKGRAAIERYNQSKKHAECQRRYRHAGKEKMATSRYRTRPDVKAKMTGREHLRAKHAQTTRTETRDGNKAEVTLYGLEKPIRNDHELIAASGMDSSRWKLVSFENKTYQAWIKNEQKQIETKQLWSAHGRFELDKQQIQSNIWLDEMIKLAQRHAPTAYKTLRVIPSPSGNLLEINLTDHHFGKLAWPPETGHSAYDLKIAEQIWKDAINTMVDRAKAFGISRVLLVLGNDLHHFDNRNNTTFKGTPQDGDGRYRKVVHAVQECSVWAIDRLLELAPVDVVAMPGNHDEESTLHLADFLTAWYRHAKDVNIDRSPAHRKYYEYGVNLIMHAHGDGGQLKDYPHLMAVEVPEKWARCPVREIHTGDKHQRKTFEDHGVAVRILPSLVPPDNWHSASGYVGNMRMTEAFVWNKTQGLIGTFAYTVPEQLQKRTA